MSDQRTNHKTKSAHRVLILAAAPVQLLDVAGPAEVLAQAVRMKAGFGNSTLASLTDAPAYEIDVFIIPYEGQTKSSSGIGLTSSLSRQELLERKEFDTLIIAGGEGARNRCGEPGIVELVRLLAGRSGRIASVCTGAFLLAEAGLLQGSRVTTHWRWCTELNRRYQGVFVDPDPIYIQDGNLWTSAGVTAGMDLTLALVEADFGHSLALSVARELVLFLRRPGDQKQFSSVLAAQSAPSRRLRDLVAWMADNLHRPLTVPEIASKACLSPRHFARAFQAEMGVTPARMVERLRVEAARRVLEDGSTSLGIVAATCGFQTEETMRRSFLRQVGVPPGEYRERFRSYPSLSIN
jgi:transcriptional regulator GlxA family with amidase domain